MPHWGIFICNNIKIYGANLRKNRHNATENEKDAIFLVFFCLFVAGFGRILFIILLTH